MVGFMSLFVRIIGFLYGLVKPNNVLFILLQLFLLLVIYRQTEVTKVFYIIQFPFTLWVLNRGVK